MGHLLRRHPLLRHRLLRHRLLRGCRGARLGLAGIALLLRVRLTLWLRARVLGALRLVGGGGITGLLGVAASTPRGTLRHAGLRSRRPALRGSLGRCAGILARWRRLLWPRWHLAWHRLRVGPVDGRDRPLLIGRDVGSRGALEHRLTASQQVQQAALIDIEVAREGGVNARGERELATLELPKEIEGLAGATDAAPAGVCQRTRLEGIDPIPTRLSELQDARLAVVDHLIEESEQPNAIDGAERRGLGLGSRLPFALGEELHTAVTGDGRLSLPV